MRGLVNRLLCLAAFLAPGGYSLRPMFQRWRGVRMGQKVWLSHLVYLDALYPSAITIGNNVTIGLRSTIFTHFHRGPAREHGYRDVTIEDDVFIGPQCVILPGVHIGHGAVIKAGTVLSRNVPPLTFWGADEGHPLGQVTVPLTPEHDYREFLQGLRLSPSRGAMVRSVEPIDTAEASCARFEI
jgi:carbonic anhydrase/acetyltransferase-like protein (isoleucine patch superfamily)